MVEMSMVNINFNGCKIIALEDVTGIVGFVLFDERINSSY